MLGNFRGPRNQLRCPDPEEMRLRSLSPPPGSQASAFVGHLYANSTDGHIAPIRRSKTRVNRRATTSAALSRTSSTRHVLDRDAAANYARATDILLADMASTDFYVEDDPLGTPDGQQRKSDMIEEAISTANAKAQHQGSPTTPSDKHFVTFVCHFFFDFL